MPAAIDIEPGAARDQKAVQVFFCVIDAFEKVFPAAVLMDFIEDQEFVAVVPRLVENLFAVCGVVIVQVKATFELVDE